MGSSQGANNGHPDFPGNVAYRLEIARGTGGESGFDDVNPQLFQLLGDLHLFFNGHAYAGGLLAVTEGGIQKFYPVVCHDDYPSLSA